MARSRDLRTPLARFSFVRDIFTPKPNEAGKLLYGGTLLFSKGLDLSDMQNAALEACIAEWGDKAPDMIKSGVIKSPFLDGDGPDGVNKTTGVRHDGYAGCTFIRVSSGADYPPQLYDAKMVPVPRSSEKDPSCPIYSGAYGYAVVNAYTWTHPKKGKGVSFSHSIIQATKPGERLGGGGGPDPDKFLKAETVPDEGEIPSEAKTGSGAAGFFG